MHTMTRRHLLQVGALALGGLASPSLASVPAGKHKARAKSVIFLHQWGGPSHHDTFDMKPAAPDSVRGEFKPSASRLPGVPVCERLPRMATVMDKVTVIRSIHHTMKNHNSA